MIWKWNKLSVSTGSNLGECRGDRVVVLCLGVGNKWLRPSPRETIQVLLEISVALHKSAYILESASSSKVQARVRFWTSGCHIFSSSLPGQRLQLLGKAWANRFFPFEMTLWSVPFRGHGCLLSWGEAKKNNLPSFSTDFHWWLQAGVGKHFP